MTNWIILFAAALFELGWPLGFKLSTLHPGHQWLWIGLGMVSYVVSGVLLYLAQRTIPISTAYIIWTGTGAIGTFLIGILCFGDAVSLLRMLSVIMILAGIVGLELTS